MESQPYVNPYDPLAAEVGTAMPFAGRQKAFEFLYQNLTDPERTHTSLILGRNGSGKTALLRHFNSFFEETFIGIYLPMKQMPLTNERALIRTLVSATGQTLAERNYTVTRLPEFDGTVTNLREWFTDNYLLELMNILRRHRRMVYLLDDADALLQAVESGALDEDTVHFLNDVIEQFSSLGFVLTLDTTYESDIPQFTPLVEAENIFRLANLNSEDTRWLLNEPAGGRYRLSDEAVAAVQATAGGQPRFIQQFGLHLFRLWEAHPDRTALTTDDVKQISSQIYKQTEAELRSAWTATTRNERLVLTAISSLLYADPLAAVSPSGIETWLVETDFPLDATAIHAAIRGLEYREIVDNTPNGIRVTSGLMQTWLLENARLTESPPEARRGSRVQWILPVIIVVLVIALMLAANQTPQPPAQNTTPQPTVTLMTTPNG